MTTVDRRTMPAPRDAAAAALLAVLGGTPAAAQQPTA
ncbi:MAG: hypothetical protein AVDCRST_MAG11-936, partial [uncultured Gemmatimonadaceae bacterium]